MDARDTIFAALDALRASYAQRFAAAASEQALRDENAKILGKKGELTAILKGMGAVPADARKVIGERVNTLKAEVEKAFDAQLANIARARLQADLDAPPFDLSLPAREVAPLGHKHPISQMREELVAVFRSLGFAVHDGPEVELEENNFTKLGFPPDHPATDMQDSFWTTGGFLLRTHTSNVQIRAMMANQPPMAFIGPGTVYRRDDDVTHSPMFHQIEGFLVDRNVSFAHMKGVIDEFARRLYGESTKTRYRPSYFPFVEPGAEFDVACAFCAGKGCNVCKRTGWLEVGGCGMIHPVVFEACNIDPETWTGFAFGMGIDRIAMLKFGIPNIKLLFENDPRFLSQF